MKRTKLKLVGYSTTAQLKQEIQRLVREIVMIRDGGCILRGLRNCEGYINENVVLQADHLVTRANSATFADTRLIVCLCRNCHAWKHWNEKEYEKLVKNVLPKNTIELWDKAEEYRQAHKTYKPDWSMAIVLLKAELNKVVLNQCT